MRAPTVQPKKTFTVGKSVIGWVVRIYLAYLAFSNQAISPALPHPFLPLSFKSFAAPFPVGQADAATIPLDSITLGAVIQINGQNFVKIGDNRYLSVCAIESNKCLVEGQKWDETLSKCVCNTASDVVQTWTACSSLATWTDTISEADNTNTICLIDKRDKKLYETHRHSDNKCYVTDASTDTTQQLDALLCPDGQKYSDAMDICYVENGCTNPTAYLQNWPGCNSLKAWTATDTSGDTACLADQRDGKTYMVRKLPDGRCWMVNNLAYGASDKFGDDVCLDREIMTEASADNGGEASIKDKFGGQSNSTTAYGLWGDCRGTKNVAERYRDGYYYNWAAAMGQTNTWYGSSNAPTYQTNVQGLCPDGWVLPTGGTGAITDFQKLASAVNGTYAANYSDSKTYTFFNNSSYGWHGLYSGGAYGTGGLYGQGSDASYWSSTFNDASYAYNLYCTSSSVSPESSSSKYYGYSIRCLRN